MINKNTVFLFGLAMVAVALVVSRGNVVAQSEYKIGVLDTQVAIDGYNKQKDKFADLKAEMEKLQAEIEVRDAANVAEQERYNSEKESMSEEERDAFEDKLMSTKNGIMADLQRFQQDLDRRFDRLRQEVFTEIKKAVKVIGVEENYHLVLEGRDAFPPNVLYYAVPLDITQKVVDRLNADYKKS
jgi:Skp family chaperone for outer membrane proteins